MKKWRIFLLFLVLSITPFMKGCDENFGFPFAVTGSILDSQKDILRGVLNTVNDFIYDVSSYNSFILFIANILIAVLLAHVISRKVKDSKWAGPFLTALDINLFFIWCCVFLFFMTERYESAQKLFDIIWGYGYGYYMAWVPYNIEERIYKLTKILSEETLRMILTRAWFVVVTFLLAIVLILLRAAKEKSIRAYQHRR